MAFEVISIGDGEMLFNAFNGVAMIFGSGNMGKLIISGFSLGTMLIALRYLTNQEFPLNHALVGIIGYLVMFGPMTTVTIEDVYTGEVRVVANVPLGVAAPMSIVSTMGVKMTEMFETAFSTPTEASLLEGGYLNSLNTLIKLRNIGTGTMGSDNALNGDLSKTINAYIESCVMFDLELSESGHEATVEGLQKSVDLLAAMKTSFVNIDTMTYLPSAPEGLQKSCKDAYVMIVNYLNSQSFIDKIDLYVSGLLGITDATIKATQKVDEAAAALEIAGVDSQTYMRNALLSSYLKDGPSAFIKRPAQEQLNLQWASEQSMFNEIARPLMAFVEMFTVAISPIVAFLAVLGPIGITMVVRYIQMLLWIALWGPLMAVCNLYIVIVTTRALKVVADHAEASGAGLVAMTMHDQLYLTLETWLSAGGMLASSVPALSLMIVYGGSVAATNLSGKMTSGASSSVNPGRLAPDPIAMESPMKLGAKTEYSPNAGAKAAGAPAMNFSSSEGLSSQKQSAFESALSAKNAFGNTKSSINQLTQKSGSMTSHTDAQMSGFTSSNTAGSNWSVGETHTSGDGYSLTNAENEVVRAGAAVGAGPSAISAALKSEAGASATRANEITDVLQNTRSNMVSGGHQDTRSSGSSSTSSNQTFSGTEETKALADQYTSQAEAAVSAGEKYNEVSAALASSMKSTTRDGSQMAHDLVKAGAGAEIAGAQKELEAKMGSSAYNKLSSDAQHEINTTSAQALGSGSEERAALHGMLMLNNQDSLAAQKLQDKYLAPAAGGSGVNMSPEEYRDDGNTIDSLVSEEDLAGIKSKVGGESGGGDYDTGGGAEGGGGRGSSAKPSVPHMATSSEHGQKPAGNHGSQKSQQAVSSKHVSSVAASSKSGGGQKGSVRDQIKASKLLGDSPEIKGGEKLGRVIDLQTDASLDVAKDVVESGPVQQSIAAAKELLGLDKKEKSNNELLSPPSDNDLPPTPK